ncbi:hypothetical protein SRHO_G00262930 [Serrasalmus rhombeus]
MRTERICRLVYRGLNSAEGRQQFCGGVTESQAAVTSQRIPQQPRAASVLLGAEDCTAKPLDLPLVNLIRHMHR